MLPRRTASCRACPCSCSRLSSHAWQRTANGSARSRRAAISQSHSTQDPYSPASSRTSASSMRFSVSALIWSTANAMSPWMPTLECSRSSPTSLSRSVTSDPNMADPTKERCAIEHKATRRPRGTARQPAAESGPWGPNFQRDRAGPQKFCLTWGRNLDVCERLTPHHSIRPRTARTGNAGRARRPVHSG